MKFGGTKYADRDTMEMLRIADDVDEMFNNLGIRALMYTRHESYRKASCLFLATLADNLCAAGKYTSDRSDGYITFGPLDGGTSFLTERSIEHYLYLRATATVLMSTETR
ncbi:unnamed protein product [Microthlaspi erraticum]|uniref:Arabidopsis retrotransposon Orf1 C-terminal domain-containing protein n=1 Tax=Microthlaspi erraticum TaxID=1685480 RepID=A0A6D2I0N3_9BRAS|nr:unnamed protein product [Microthlaspi erraticum]CAA7019703.1 unnamed protein product [Microthlaspi erraticum]